MPTTLTWRVKTTNKTIKLKASGKALTQMKVLVMIKCLLMKTMKKSKTCNRTWREKKRLKRSLTLKSPKAIPKS